MLVRREQPGDVEQVRALVAAAFAQPDDPEVVPVEVALIDQLRADEGWLPALSLVAESAGGEVVGHVVCTRAHIDGVRALGLGPIAVRPGEQRRGIGAALMHTVLGAADALGEPLVALLGSPAYYRRFGFRPATDCGVTAPNPAWGEYFQIRALSAYQPITGTFAYAEPFRRIG